MAAFQAVRTLVALIVLLPWVAIAAESGVQCVACHADKSNADSDTWRAHKHTTCVACHGDVPGHLHDPAQAARLNTFTDEPAKVRATACESCHTAQKTPSGAYHQSEVACNQCHSIHTPPEPGPIGEFHNAAASTKLCQTCHHSVFSEFLFNETHKLLEGTVSCTDCHDPHAAKPVTALGTQHSDVCAKCHSTANGPFLFEHAASRVEGCTACHAPHGSPNRHLLRHQNVAELCFACHADVPQFHVGFAPSGPSRFGLDTVCTNCHVAVHGSNLSQALLR